MKYYLVKNRYFEEVTKEEWEAVVGEEPYGFYANKVYRNQMSIDDVPTEYQEKVMSIVENKIQLWGEFTSQEVSARELQSMLEGVL